MTEIVRSDFRVHGHAAAGPQRGVVLVVTLIFLLILTIIAVSAMLATSTDLRIAGNINFRTQALEGSERSRILAAHVLEQYLHDRSRWTPALTSKALSLGLQAVDQNRDLASEETPADPCTADMRYTEDRGTTGTFDQNDVVSFICVIRRAAELRSGSGAAVAKEYSGLGTGASGGGGAIYLALRARARGPGGASAETGSDYRHIITR